MATNANDNAPCEQCRHRPCACCQVCGNAPCLTCGSCITASCTESYLPGAGKSHLHDPDRLYGDLSLSARAFMPQTETWRDELPQKRAMKNRAWNGTMRVTGKGMFPIDMLRYECAWPATEDDVWMIAQSIADRVAASNGVRPSTDQEWTIVLRYGSRPGDITIERWKAYGWTAVEVGEAKAGDE